MLFVQPGYEWLLGWLRNARGKTRLRGTDTRWQTCMPANRCSRKPAFDEAIRIAGRAAAKEGGYSCRSPLLRMGRESAVGMASMTGLGLFLSAE